MHDLLMRLSNIAIILDKDLPKKDKVVMSLQTLSGFDITDIGPRAKNAIYNQMAKANHITKQYPITSFEDYALISEPHLDQLLRDIKQLCKQLLKECKAFN